MPTDPPSITLIERVIAFEAETKGKTVTTTIETPKPSPVKPTAKRAPIAPAVPVEIAPVAPNPLRDAILAIEVDLNKAFAEREREIRGVLVAMLAREHVLLLGPAGTAKSALANTACTAINGAKFFQQLLTRFSPPEELFGPISLDGLKNDRHRRVTTGKLPECHVAFVDEIFKANSAVLNSMLTAINERAFDNDGQRVSIPLEMVVGASNELPEGPELAALFDRFMLRFWVSYTKTPDAFRRLIVGSEPQIYTTISLGDLKMAQAEVEALPIASSAVDELFKLRDEIAKDGMVASDRRWRKSIRILRAAAWLEGATEVTVEAFPILASVLWETVDQVAKLQKLVAKYTSKELSDAQHIADAVLELVNNLPPRGSEAFGQQVVMVTKELKVAAGKVAKLAEDCKGTQSKARIATIAAQVKARHDEMLIQARESLGL